MCHLPWGVMQFKANAAGSLANVALQGNLMNAKGKFVTKRAEAIRDLDDFEGTRDAAAAIRNKVIDNLDLWLERFEQKAIDTGATVLWAKDGAEVDFAIARDGALVQLVECKLADERPHRALRRFAEQFPAAEAVQLVLHARQPQDLPPLLLRPAAAWLHDLAA